MLEKQAMINGLFSTEKWWARPTLPNFVGTGFAGMTDED